MLHAFICEDDPRQRQRIEKIVNGQIIQHNYDIDLALSTHSPSVMLDYLKTHPDKRGLYFLDVDLGHTLNGIELAAKIKEVDVNATIVFISTHGEMVPLTFRHKVEAMDFIVKENNLEEIEAQVVECMQIAHTRYLAGKNTDSKLFIVETADQRVNVPYDDILYFETHPTMRNKVILYMQGGKLEFRSFISDIAQIDPMFQFCHQSYLVNVKKIKQIDKVGKEIELLGGERLPIARRRVTELLRVTGE